MIKVVRNDLSDSDFQVVPSRQRPKTSVPEDEGMEKSARQPIGVVWNRLSARLLRQAAQEFNVVQKQRGKLLSQVGHGEGSGRGA
jgi:hypothetical protein